MATDKQGRAQLAKLARQMKNLTDGAEAEGRDYFTSAERERFHVIENDYSKQEALVAANEGAAGMSAGDARISSLLSSGQPRISDVDLGEIRDQFRISGRRTRDPHAQAFSAYLRAGGLEGLSEEHRAVMRTAWRGPGGGVQNAQTTSPASGGGYTVPQGFSYQLEEAMKFWGGIDGVTGSFETEDGRPMPWPSINDTANMGRLIGENQQVIETDLVFNSVTFGAYIASSDIVLIPLALVEDSAFDLDRLVAKLLGIRLGRLRNYYATLGTGSNQPTGIVTAAVNAGLIYTCPAGETATVTYDDLVNLEAEVDPAYRYTPSTRWMFSDSMLTILKKLVDGNNRPLWSPGLTASFQDSPAVQLAGPRPTILGHEYIVNPNMPVPAANATSILFGCFDTFKVRKLQAGITLLTLRERYADYLQRGYIAFERWDSNLIDAGTHPIAVLKQAAS
jgi:HK97 family phage major capsid protein